MPAGGALGSRRRVPRPLAPGVAEARRDDGDPGLVVEGGPVDRQPFPQPVPAGVVPWNTSLVQPPGQTGRRGSGQVPWNSPASTSLMNLTSPSK
jgi:hypothetical protein